MSELKMTPAELLGEIECACRFIESQSCDPSSLLDARDAVAALIAENARLREVAEKAAALLKRTPKVMRDMYVGKDRIAWGVQAKTVHAQLVAALAGAGHE